MTPESSKTEQIMTGTKEIEALFVQTSGTMTYADGHLTLDDVAPTTLFFSDRPDRVTGHVTSEEFVGSWTSGDDSFAADPPNAVLSIFHPGEVQDVVVVLKNPSLSGHKLTYDVDVLDGEMPAKGGANSLFIDVIGRPLTPVSFAGMRRREDRRMGRRMMR